MSLPLEHRELQILLHVAYLLQTKRKSHFDALKWPHWQCCSLSTTVAAIDPGQRESPKILLRSKCRKSSNIFVMLTLKATKHFLIVEVGSLAYQQNCIRLISTSCTFALCMSSFGADVCMVVSWTCACFFVNMLGVKWHVEQTCNQARKLLPSCQKLQTLHVIVDQNIWATMQRHCRILHLFVNPLQHVKRWTRVFLFKSVFASTAFFSSTRIKLLLEISHNWKGKMKS